MNNENFKEVLFKTSIENPKKATAISILIQDLESSSKLQNEEGAELLLRISKVLKESYLDKERKIIIDFSFEFYSELSRSMGVSENLISENCTHAENYFKEFFKNE